MIIIILVLVFLLLCYYSEKFNNEFYNISFPSNENTTSIYDNRLNLIPTTININVPNNMYNNKIKSNKCCLVKKELNMAKYKYQKYNDLDCDIDNFILDNNNQLLFDGINNWNNNECNDNSIFLGSCKNNNLECFDFIDKKTCDDYKLTWSNKPCYVI